MAFKPASLLTAVLIAAAWVSSAAADNGDLADHHHHKHEHHKHKHHQHRHHHHHANKTSAGPSTGEVVPLSYEKDTGDGLMNRLLLSPKIGSSGQKPTCLLAGMNPDLIFATGSYKPDASAKDTGTVFNSPYAGSATGKIYKDTVSVGDATATQVPIGVLDQPNNAFGQCGIAWPAPQSSFFTDAAVPSIFHILKSEGAIKPSKFCLMYNLDTKKPALGYGSIVPDAVGGMVKSDSQAPGYWSIPGQIGGVKDFLIIDPSASLILAAPNESKQIITSLGLTPITLPDGGISASYPCDKPPTFVITLGGKVKVPLTKAVMTYTKDDKGNCLLPLRGYEGNSYPPTLGSPFIASVKHLIFDLDTNSVGIVPL